MTTDQIRTVSVIGSGTMGNGIAQVFAANGYATTLIDLKQELLDRAVNSIGGSLDRIIKKGVITEADKTATMGRLSTATDLSAAKSSQLVVEAVTEDLKIKTSVFQTLESVCPAETIFASNTSSLPITQLASTTKRPGQFVGMHFMNPVPVMKLVEIIRGLATTDETCRLVSELSVKLGKTPLEAQDYPGFIANRILMPMINEAVFALMEGVGTKESIDEVMKLGMGHPMGPLTLADFIGLDVCLAILEVLHAGLGDPKYRPCPLLRKMVQAGYLGRKSGRGFYSYDK